jgi:hypothetical protein
MPVLARNWECAGLEELFALLKLEAPKFSNENEEEGREELLEKFDGKNSQKVAGDGV